MLKVLFNIKNKTKKIVNFMIFLFFEMPLYKHFMDYLIK